MSSGRVMCVSMSFRFRHFVLSLSLAGTLSGCKTPCSEEQFAGPFAAEKVARLAHESFKIAWQTKNAAQTDLRFSPIDRRYFTNRLDWQVVRRLDRISTHVPWIARDIEKNPSKPRCASKFAYEIVASDTAVLRASYRSASFRGPTNVQIDELLHKLAEISSYYELRGH